MPGEYITLVTSLPVLTYFEKADRLPITEQALDQRLKMLSQDDAAQLQRAVNLLRWRRHAVTASTEKIDRDYRNVMSTTSNPGLRDYVDWRINGRAAMAALRLKARGQNTRPERTWGAGRLVRTIARNWEKPDVGLKAVFPWLEEAWRYLQSGDALSLERLQMAVVWRRLTTLAELNTFGFESVAAYVFKWDILHRWLQYNAQQATVQFQKMIGEVLGEHRLAWA